MKHKIFLRDPGSNLCRHCAGATPVQGILHDMITVSCWGYLWEQKQNSAFAFPSKEQTVNEYADTLIFRSDSIEMSFTESCEAFSNLPATSQYPSRMTFNDG
ncbi:hypothetical protein HUU40_09950 [candidate division KSB1 bacterium]|nr:hypothetical protein [candidate division KSB1 bacterium]